MTSDFCVRTIPREFEISKKSSTRNQKILDFFIENGKNLKLIQSVELFEEFEEKDEIYGYSLQLPKEYDLLDVEKFVQRVKKNRFLRLVLEILMKLRI